MKIKNLQLREKMYIGDFISIAMGDKFVLGLVEQIEDKASISLRVNMEPLWDGEQELRLVAPENGAIPYFCITGNE